ncbi:MAG: hypothetical protein JNL21_22760 [Myxococcales bacterium]|nr:hypothetical protein [Myxococcales bacterium]
MKLLPTLTSLFLLAGCAAAPAPQVVRATELARMGVAPEGQPLVILFEPGDKIPLAVTVEGPLVRSPDGLAPVALEVKQRFYLRIEDGEMRTSADGVSFSDPAEPGSLAFGFGATKDGPTASVKIVTPTLKSAN